MTFTVRLAPLAVEDMAALDSWIIAEAGQDVADAYLDRVYARIASLRDFPFRGTPREDLGHGVRSLSFERRLILAYVVIDDVVLILRIAGSQRDLAALFDA